jgi:AI-2 transport protein TqsA
MAMNTSLRNEQVGLAVGSLMILAVVALAAALVYTRDVMIPFVLAIFITVVVAPIVDVQVVRLGLPRWLAVSVALLLVLVLLSLVVLTLVVAGQAAVRAAGEYGEQVAELSKRVVQELNERHLQVDQARISTELEARLPSFITQAAGTFSTVMSSGVLIAIFVVFLLAGRDPRRRRTGIYAEIETTIRRYLATKAMIAAVTGLSVGFILWLLGLRFAVLFGLLAFLLDFIPNIGSVVATLLPIPVAVTQFGGTWTALAVVAIPAAVQLTISNLIEPRLMGRGLELHPVTIILALAFWGLLWGIIGMVLAVPIVAAIRIVLSQFETTRTLSNLLAGRLPGAAPGLSVR